MKRLLLILSFICFALSTFATHQYFRNVNSATGTLWGTAENWSLTSGGGATGAVPLATDTVYLDANSNDTIVVNTSNRVCKTLIMTNYTGTLTMTKVISVSGSVFLGSGMHVLDAQYLNIIASGNFASNGFVWPNGIVLAGSTQTTIFNDACSVGFLQFACTGSGGTITLNGNLTIASFFKFGSGTLTHTINGAYKVYVGGDLQQLGTTSFLTGTATIEHNGTGNWSCTGTGTIRNNVIINTIGSLTITGNVYYFTGTLTNIQGLTAAVGSTLNVGTCTLNLGGVALYNFSINTASSIIILSSNFNISNSFTNVDATSVNYQTIKSNSPCTQRTFTMLSGSTNTLSYLNAIDIDSHLGLPIISMGAGFYNSLNWYANSSDLTNMFMLW